MADPARQTLRELIVQFGQTLCDEPKRFKGLLSDLCPDLRREVYLLSSALEEQVVADLRQGLAGQAWGAILARLSRRLVDDRGLEEGYARWAVESWALALGVIEEAPACVRGGESGLAPSPPPVIVTDIAGSIRLKLIPAGDFWMGSPRDDPEAFADQRPRHRVRISRSFYLGVTPITQAQYEAIVGLAPSHFRGRPANPVESLSWFDAARFCNELSRKEGLALYYSIRKDQMSIVGGPGYRLPTEAEWEYACRAGTESGYGSGGRAAVGLDECAWYWANAGERTWPVEEKRPNEWGLFDMLGNVWEWCWDWYDADYYRRSPAVDPPGGTGSGCRVIRGGSWFVESRHVRPASRGKSAPTARTPSLGSRVARGQS